MGDADVRAACDHVVAVLREAGRVEGTVRGYQGVLDRFVLFLAGRGLDVVSDGVCVDFIAGQTGVRLGSLLEPVSDHAVQAVRRPVVLMAATAGAPSLLAADRGYWDSTIEADLTEIGVDTVVIPRTGKPSQARQTIEHADTFVAAVKWRTGCEGRISALEREYGWRRTRLRTHTGARTWCAHGVFAHNLTNSSDSKHDRRGTPKSTRRHQPSKRRALATAERTTTTNQP